MTMPPNPHAATAEELLPCMCEFGTPAFRHGPECPAHYRPAIAQALEISEERGRMKQVNDLMAIYEVPK